jgi:phosphoglycolate phosphatase
MTTISTVLFDLDGTLIDSSKDLMAAYLQLLAEHERDAPSAQQLKHDVAHGVNHLFERDFGAKPGTPKNKQLRREFTHIYESNLTQYTELFAGIGTILEQLTQRDIPWGIVTNKIERFTRPIIEHFAELRPTQTLICGDTLSQKKPDPFPITYACQQLQAIPEKTAFVGDTQVDIVAAKRAGAKGVAVDYNIPIAAKDAQAWGATVLLHQPADLWAWLENRLS